MYEPVESNLISATIFSNHPFIDSLKESVTNDNSNESATLWIWRYLSEGGDKFLAYDKYHDVVQAICNVWEIFSVIEGISVDRSAIAKFLIERIPAALNDRVSISWCEPTTLALILAERAHDLEALFSIGLKPNGSKDPYALRRTAKHFIIAAIMVRINNSFNQIDYI